MQPKLHQFPMMKFGSQNRGFSVKFYTEYPFIEYSISNDTVFCFPCRMFPCGSGDTALTTAVQDWKNLSYKLRKHASSQSHMDSCCKWEAFQCCKQTGSVVSELSDQHRIMVTDNRQYVGKIIDILLYLCCQGISLRGHGKSADSRNKGNFLELCSLFALHDNVFASNLRKYFNLTGHVLQNQLIKIAANHVTHQIAEDDANVGFFSR